jgi:hypothetical protein
MACPGHGQVLLVFSRMAGASDWRSGLYDTGGHEGPRRIYRCARRRASALGTAGGIPGDSSGY